MFQMVFYCRFGASRSSTFIHLGFQVNGLVVPVFSEFSSLNTARASLPERVDQWPLGDVVSGEVSAPRPIPDKTD